jgi:hypothetical protein
LWSGAIRAGGYRLPTYFNDQVTGVNDIDRTELLTLAVISYRGCEFDLSNPHERPLLAQIAVNHLDAHLQKLGIYDGQLNTLAVFAPIRV